MSQIISKLRPGDLVEVRTPDEILRTLDADGTLKNLPFMPEMIKFCGGRFRVLMRVVKTCCSSSLSSGMRGFDDDDVVLLDGLRCSGADHAGCQKACMIFWREAWLRKVSEGAAQSEVDPNNAKELRSRLKTTAGPATYFCQASELLKATHNLSKWERIGKCFSEVRAGNCSALQMAQRLAKWVFWRSRRVLVGEYARGSAKFTPAETLNLRPGEQVEVKPVASIIATVNEKACNRGLYFSPDMRVLCDTRQQVKEKVQKIIVDGTGEMRKLHNTVFLEGSLCGCVNALGGCPRSEFMYWREIWLRRASHPANGNSQLSGKSCAQVEVTKC